MPNTALNRTTQVLLTNKSGGNLNYGDVVVLDNTNSNGFTTTTTSGLSTRQIGVILEPNGIANNASGMVATGGWAPRCNLNTAATIGQFIKSHTVAGQGTPHSSPQQEGDFAVALTASATPPVCLFGSPNGPTAGTGTVTNTGTLTSGKTIVGNGSADVTVSSLTAQFVGSSSGTAAAASMTTARLLGRTTASSGAVEEITVSTGLSLSAGVLTSTVASKVVQVVNTQTGAVATGSTVVPIDDTIPQNTEGDQYMTLAVTPTSSSNLLQIDVVFNASPAATQWVVASLYQDSTANALATVADFQNQGGGLVNLKLSYRMTAGTTSATTFKVRGGPGASTTLTFNGGASARLFGGVISSSITITELVP